jgi:peptide/nickel transport system substrate-binding protein
MQEDEQAKLLTTETNTMEWLAFDIRHSSYDDGLNFSGLKPDHPDLFGDVRVRKAVALCLDRQKVADTVLFGFGRVPDSYLAFDNPLHNGVLQKYDFNPASGREILEQVGWIDHDKNPSTPRHALGVTRVPNGTPLMLNYLTSSATQRRQVVEILTESLAECGVGLNPIYVTASELYAQGPAGPLFGRNYELAQYAIGTDSLTPQCNWFTSDQIPAASNQWVGTNVSGYANDDFDVACKQAQQSLPGEEGYSGYQKSQAIFANDIPSIPLFARLKIAATRNDFCGFSLDPSSLYSLTDIESFDYGAGCQ